MHSIGKEGRNGRSVPLLQGPVGATPLGEQLSDDNKNWLFTAVLFVMARNWQQPKRPPIGNWLNTRRYLRTREYCEAVNRE